MATLSGGIFSAYSISCMLFFLVSINILIEVNTRLIELGSTSSVSKGRLTWYYFSSTYAYIIKVIAALFVILCLISIITIAVSNVVNQFSFTRFFGNASNSIIWNYGYVFSYSSYSLREYFVLLPICALVIFMAFATSIYIPGPAPSRDDTSEGDELINNKTVINITTHNYLYFMFVLFVLVVFLFEIWLRN